MCCHAYDTQFSCTYDTHLPHNPNPNHRVAYTRQSPYLPTSFNFYLVYQINIVYIYALQYILYTMHYSNLAEWLQRHGLLSQSVALEDMALFWPTASAGKN